VLRKCLVGQIGVQRIAVPRMKRCPPASAAWFSRCSFEPGSVWITCRSVLTTHSVKSSRLKYAMHSADPSTGRSPAQLSELGGAAAAG